MKTLYFLKIIILVKIPKMKKKHLGVGEI